MSDSGSSPSVFIMFEEGAGGQTEADLLFAEVFLCMGCSSDPFPLLGRFTEDLVWTTLECDGYGEDEMVKLPVGSPLILNFASWLEASVREILMCKLSPPGL